METTNSKILSFEEWTANKANGETQGDEIQSTENPAPAEEPVTGEDEPNLSVNMLDAEPTAIEPEIEVEDQPEADSKESETEDNA